VNLPITSNVLGAMNDTELPKEPFDGGPFPGVSILIPVHNCLPLTQACVESILQFTTGLESLEILIIDDGSTDGTAEFFSTYGRGVRVLENDVRLTFAQKMNHSVPLAQHEFLCLLNNDIVVTEGWLAPMFSLLRSDPAIAVVGNRQLRFSTGLLDHAGIIFNSEGIPLHLYRKQPADFWPALVSQEFQAVTAACWLLRRETFLDLGGFDPVFRNGWEDVDFCLRARQRGLKVFYAAESVVHHHGFSTPGRKDHEQANMEFFKCKWGASIVPDLDQYYVIPKPEPEPPRTVDPPTIPVLESPKEPSHIEKRYSHIEHLHARHPLIASLLGTIVRFATSLAKAINRISR
jgi:GT2 family glycosyltransferase